jgi:hypothetical protein
MKKQTIWNWRVKRLDESIVMGGAFALFIWFFSNTKISGDEFILIFICGTIFIHFCSKIAKSRKLEDEQKYKSKKINQKIDNAILSMYSSGLSLRFANDHMYVFETKNVVLPNAHFLLKDCKDHCTLIGHDDELIILKDIWDLKNESKNKT